MFKQYTIANGNSEQALIQVVDQAMQQGWQPIGGVTVVVTVPGQAAFLQAIAKL